MYRREVLKKAALFGAAAVAVRSVASAADSSTGKSATPAVTFPALHVPASGTLPVAFVIAKRAEVLDFAGPLEVFAGAGATEGKQLFTPYMVAAAKEPVTVGAGMKVVPEYTFGTAPAPRVVVIPAMDLDDTGPEMYDWIRSVSKTTDVTMSVCNGAFVLAKTGLLAGKSATCHHSGYFRFAGTYPDVHLKRGARFVVEGNLASAGGVSSGIDLALNVVDRYLGRDATLSLADLLEYQGSGWLNPDSNVAYARLPKFEEAHPICPVCLMNVDRSIKSTYKSKTYYFCASSEKEFFEQHLNVFDRFLMEDAAQSGK
jgi:putative intracellular protease/amidase/YHS domain-containing protein